MKSNANECAPKKSGLCPTANTPHPSARPSPAQILVVFLHGIGDHLMASPAIRALKQKYPDRQITIMSIRHKVFEDLWRYNPDVSNVIFSSLDYNPRYAHPSFWFVTYWRIRKDIQLANRGNRFEKVFFVKIFMVPTFIYSRFKFWKFYKPSRIARELGVTIDNDKTTFSYPDEYDIWADAYLAEKNPEGSRIVGLHYHASSPTRSLKFDTAKNIVSTLTSAGFTVLTFDSQKSYDAHPEKVEGKQVINVISDNIYQTAAIINKCEFLVCIDSGIMHLAGALDKKVFCLFPIEAWKRTSELRNDNARSFVLQGNENALSARLGDFLREMSHA